MFGVFTMPSQPNILLLFPDQWRGDALSILDHPVVETPFLDDIASEGVVFTSAYAACPSCIAARANMATGLTPNSCGRLGYRDGVPWRYPVTMMTCLRDGGYQTFSAGKNHFYPQRAALGFEEMRLYETQHHLGEADVSDYHDWLARESGGLVRDTAVEMNNNSWVVRQWPHAEYLHPTAWNTTAAIELLNRRDPTRPFFMQVGYHRPHPPLDPPPEFMQAYEHKTLPPVPLGQWAEKYGHEVHQSCINTGCVPDGQLDRARRAYYALISHVDYHIGRLLYYLTKRGWLHNTLVLFTSDHGEQLGDHHIHRKTHGLEGSAKLPFFIRPPAGMEIPPGRCDLPVTHMDIMPTVLEAAGLPVPEHVEGASLLPLLRREKVAWRPYVHGEHAGTWACQYVTDGKEKFIWNTVTGDELFFDLRVDPQEECNLADDPAHADRLKLWRSRLAEVLAERPEDGLVEGGKLVAGNTVPPVRPELLTAQPDPDGVIRPHTA